MTSVPRIRSAGPVGLALTAFDLWRRIPAQQRKQIAREVRKHGPRIVAQAVRSVRDVRGSFRPKP